ncbi:MAG: hypothetical protein AAF431_05570 [Pseudomonadota bacterium]
MKFGLIASYLLVTVFTLIASSTSKLMPGQNLCENKLVSAAAPWSSGCFYQAYFADNPSPELIVKERVLLEKFVGNNGVASDVLWYRSVFHQKFRLKLRTSYQNIHAMHQRYTQADHKRIDLQVQYLTFLVRSDLVPLAQSTLDEYCTAFIPANRRDLTKEIEWRLREGRLPLSLDSCVTKTSQPIQLMP